MPRVRRSVIDRTGLAGYFDADFDFMAEFPPPPPPPGLPNAFGSEPFVEVLVIDRVERPSRTIAIY